MFNILLQVLDDGRLSDSQGHTVDFTNTIIVMTSNIGSQVIQEISQEGGSEEQIREAVMRDAADPLPARVPQPHRRDPDLPSPVGRQICSRSWRCRSSGCEQAAARKGIELEVTAAAIDAIAVEGYDPTYGARPLKRVIQQRIQNPLAVEISSAICPRGAGSRWTTWMGSIHSSAGE